MAGGRVGEMEDPPRICSVSWWPEDQAHHQLARGLLTLLSFRSLSFPTYRMEEEVAEPSGSDTSLMVTC